MNTKKVLFVALAGLIPLAGFAGPVKFRTEISPIGGITSSDIDGLGVRHDTSYGTYAEIIDGQGNYLGTLELGVEIDTKIGYVDVLGGFGGAVNGAWGGGLFLLDGGYRFKLNGPGTMTIGPFVGLVAAGDTEWETDEGGMIDMSGDSGAQVGVKFTWGWRHVSFLAKLGYMSFAYELEPEDQSLNWRYTRNGGDSWQTWGAGETVEADMSGFFGQFGVTLQF